MITRARISNFKSFKDFEIDLQRNNVIVGANMSGKSNLVDFFKFVQDLFRPTTSGAQGVYSAFNPRNGFREVAWRGAEVSRLEFELEGEIKLPGNSPLVWLYKVEFAGNFQWNSAQIASEQLTVTTAEGKLDLIRSEGPRRLVFDRTGKQLYEAPDTSRLALESSVQDWGGNLVRNLILSWRFYDLVPPLMKQLNATAAPASLNVLGENLSAWLMLLQTRYSEAFSRIRNAAIDVLPGLKDLYTTPTEQSTVFTSSNEDGLNRPIPVWQMSDGELAFIALLSLIFAPDLGGTIYFIEEPERYLHPKLVSALVDILRQVQQELGPERSGQLVLTTHAPLLVDRFDIEELRVLAKSHGSTTLIRPRNKEHLRQIITDEGIGLGDLYYSGALNFA